MKLEGQIPFRETMCELERTCDWQIPFSCREMHDILKNGEYGWELKRGYHNALGPGANLQESFEFINHELFLDKPSQYAHDGFFKRPKVPEDANDFFYIHYLYGLIGLKLIEDGVEKREGKSVVKHGQRTMKHLERLMLQYPGIDELRRSDNKS
jgi:hypothetical protein